MSNDTGGRWLGIVLLVIGALVIVPMVLMGVAMVGFGPMMGGMWGSPMWGDGAMPGWTFGLAIAMQLLFVAALVGAGYLVFRALVASEGESDRALEELRLAYARGDLTDEEYEHRREALERDSESR